MERNPVVLNAPERFSEIPEISKEKITKAIDKAVNKLEEMGNRHGTDFPSCWAVNSQYRYSVNDNWVGGMYTGCFWLAYLLTGKRSFKEKAEALTDTFRKRIDDRVGVDDHDVGFAFSPSCVAAYKLTGVQNAKRTALDAAEYFYNTSYSKEGKFIIRSWKSWERGDGCRTMMDSLMNAPLLYWAAEQTGNGDYRKAAHDHVKTTADYLIRADGSSYHHYQFDPKTAAAVRGLTFQGHRDESCWSRGHAWGVYGFPIAYSYDKCDFMKDVHRDVTYFMLNHLPDDCIPYWDYDFVSGDEPRDSSAGVISVCGMLEMARFLPDGDENKRIFRSAAAQILEATIDKCTDGIGEYDDGLINHVTAALPQKLGIDQTAVYGDYFYLEALARYVDPLFKKFW